MVLFVLGALTYLQVTAGYPASVLQKPEIPEGLINYPVFVRANNSGLRV